MEDSWKNLFLKKTLINLVRFFEFLNKYFLKIIIFLLAIFFFTIVLGKDKWMNVWDAYIQFFHNLATMGAKEIFLNIFINPPLLFIFFVLIFYIAIVRPLIIAVWNTIIENIFVNQEFDFEDAPVEKQEQDLLGRGDQLDRIFTLITQNRKTTFSLLLDAEWGSGKTSFWNLLKERIYREFKNDYIIFEFNPWFLSCEKNLMLGFFEQLEKKLLFLELPLKRLKDLVVQNIEKKFSVYMSFDARSLEDIKKSISKQLKTRGRKLIVFIDDIDRLEKEEKILEVFKVVGEFQNLENIIFILSFDRRVIENRLNKLFEADPNYLDKIVNYPMYLGCSEKKVREYLKNLVKKTLTLFDFEKNQINNFAIQPFVSREEYYITSDDQDLMFSSLRSVKIFWQLFITRYPLMRGRIQENMQGEIYLPDFFRLTYLEVFYPEIYNIILKNKFPLVEYRSQTETGNKQEQNDIKQLKLVFADVFTKKDVNENKRIKIILCNLFPIMRLLNESQTNVAFRWNDRGQIRKDNRICHPDSFDKYFLDRIHPKMSDVFVKNALHDWNLLNDKTKQTIFNQDPKRIRLFLEELTKKNYLLFIEDCYSLLAFYNNRDDENFYDCAIAIRDVSDLMFQPKDRYDLTPEMDKKLTTQKFTLLKKIVKNCSDIRFAGVIIQVYEAKNGWGRWEYDNKTKFLKEAKQMLKKRMSDEFIKPKTSIFNDNDADHYWSFVRFVLFLAWGKELYKQKEIQDYLFEQMNSNQEIFFNCIPYSTVIGSGKKTFSSEQFRECLDFKRAKEFFMEKLNKKMVKTENKWLIKELLREFNL